MVSHPRLNPGRSAFAADRLFLFRSCRSPEPSRIRWIPGHSRRWHDRPGQPLIRPRHPGPHSVTTETSCSPEGQSLQAAHNPDEGRSGLGRHETRSGSTSRPSVVPAGPSELILVPSVRRAGPSIEDFGRTETRKCTLKNIEPGEHGQQIPPLVHEEAQSEPRKGHDTGKNANELFLE